MENIMINDELSAERENEHKYIILEILAIAALATGGIFVKLSDLPPINTGFYRVLLSLPILYPLVRKKLHLLGKKDIFLMMLAGGFLAGDLSLWNISFHLTTVANGNLLANLVSFTIIPVSYFVFKERIPPYFLFGTVIVLLGVLCLMFGKIEPSVNNFIGDLLAFSTSIFYAAFMLIVYKLRNRVDAMTIMWVSAWGTCIVLLFVILLTEGIQIPKQIDSWYPLIGLTLMSQLCGQGGLSYCLGKVRASLSSVIVLLQPVIAAVYALILFGETLSSLEILGIAITLTGIYISKKAF